MAEGRLPASTRLAALEHLAGCVRCTGIVRRLERVVALLRADALEDAPVALQTRAALLLRAAAPVRPNLRRRVLAALRFDSAQRPLAMGARAGQVAPRQLLFLAEGRQLDLRIAPEGTLWSLAGQVLGPDEPGDITLEGPGARWTAPLNGLGEFSLPTIPLGSYMLSLHLADLDIEIPNVTVGYEV